MKRVASNDHSLFFLKIETNYCEQPCAIFALLLLLLSLLCMKDRYNVIIISV